jgi:hypothetical protein
MWLESLAILRRGDVEHGKKAAELTVMLAIPAVMPAIFTSLVAFSSEVEPGSRKENASNQESRAPF